MKVDWRRGAEKGTCAVTTADADTNEEFDGCMTAKGFEGVEDDGGITEEAVEKGLLLLLLTLLDGEKPSLAVGIEANAVG